MHHLRARLYPHTIRFTRSHAPTLMENKTSNERQQNKTTTGHVGCATFISGKTSRVSTHEQCAWAELGLGDLWVVYSIETTWKCWDRTHNQDTTPAQCTCMKVSASLVSVSRSDTTILIWSGVLMWELEYGLVCLVSASAFLLWWSKSRAGGW